MRMIESRDGTVRLLELDPTKQYCLIIDHNAMTLSDKDRRRLITALQEKRAIVLMKRPGSHVAVVESGDVIIDIQGVVDVDET